MTSDNATLMLAHSGTATWDDDDEADVLYLSLGESRPAVGVGVGEGLVLRYDEASGERVGLTLVGTRGRLRRELADA